MKTSYKFMGMQDSCGYLPSQAARMEYEQVERMSAAEFGERLLAGWRRFGHTLFRPQCAQCGACRSIRINVAGFQPNRSQRRVARANAGGVELHIGEPELTLEKLELYHLFHADRAHSRGWSWHLEDPISYLETFVSNPFPVEEWCYYIDGRLVGVGYVDALPLGLSAIYFYHDPEHVRRNLGTWNVLCLIEAARHRRLPHLYLGYYVADCVSLAYKSRFRPHEFLGSDGQWRAPDSDLAVLESGPCRAHPRENNGEISGAE